MVTVERPGGDREAGEVRRERLLLLIEVEMVRDEEDVGQRPGAPDIGTALVEEGEVELAQEAGKTALTDRDSLC